MTRTACFSLLLAASLSGCFIVDSSLYENLPRAGTDLGVDGGTTDLGTEDLGTDTDLGPADGGGPRAATRCGDTAAPLLIGTTRGLRVDTTGADTATLTPRGCPSMAIGNDAFYRIEVVAGDYWHFHLQADSAFSEPDRNPIVYAVKADGSGGCQDMPTSCQSVFANACTGRSDEHFGFTAPSSGTFYIGVDDATPGGGHYALDVIRPECGNGVQEHGEPCDEADAGVGVDAGGPASTCNRSCRKIVGATAGGTFPSESEVNDNQREANVVSFVGTTSVLISGDVGVAGDCYPDVFEVNVPAGGDLSVGQMGCSSDPGFRVDLRDSTGSLRGGGAVGCPSINVTDLPAGAYFVSVRASDPGDLTPAFYNINITNLP